MILVKCLIGIIGMLSCVLNALWCVDKYVNDLTSGLDSEGKRILRERLIRKSLSINLTHQKNVEYFQNKR